jgi:hypothetical protein
MPDLTLVAALVFHLLAVLLMPLQLFKIQMGVLAPYMGHLLQCKEEVQFHTIVVPKFIMLQATYKMSKTITNWAFQSLKHRQGVN